MSIKKSGWLESWFDWLVVGGGGVVWGYFTNQMMALVGMWRESLIIWLVEVEPHENNLSIKWCDWLENKFDWFTVHGGGVIWRVICQMNMWLVENECRCSLKPNQHSQNTNNKTWLFSLFIIYTYNIPNLISCKFMPVQFLKNHAVFGNLR